jgi:hypothetical protein
MFLLYQSWHCVFGNVNYNKVMDKKEDEEDIRVIKVNGRNRYVVIKASPNGVEVRIRVNKTQVVLGNGKDIPEAVADAEPFVKELEESIDNGISRRKLGGRAFKPRNWGNL